MNKGLETLDYLKRLLEKNIACDIRAYEEKEGKYELKDIRIFNYNETYFDAIEKELKALNFIKEEINFGFEIVNNQTRLTLTVRGVKVMSKTIDKEKYDLLKEVFVEENEKWALKKN